MSNTPVTLDVNDLTLEEVEMIEEHIGQPIDVAFGPGSSKGKALRTVAWVLGRRDNPEFTYEDTASIRMSDVTMGESEAAAEG